jgi:hypothetical protein
MRGKLLFITGGLVGYVLGTRAGRKRYEQIVAAAENVWTAPPVQRRVNEARDFALERVGDVPGALFDAGKKLVIAVQAKKSGSTDAVSTPAKVPAKAPAKRVAARPAAAKPASDDTPAK